VEDGKAVARTPGSARSTNKTGLRADICKIKGRRAAPLGWDRKGWPVQWTGRAPL